MSKLSNDQLKKIIKQRFIVDYIETFDVAEYHGFKTGVGFVLKLFDYDDNIDQIYYDFEQFASEQKFLEKTGRKYSKEEIEKYIDVFFGSQPDSQ